MAVLNLTRAKWKDFKAKNSLSKSTVFSKADVGPHIDEFAKAVEAYRAVPSTKGILKVSSKATALQKAFEKFIVLKDAKAEMTTGARGQIEKWKSELDKAHVELAKTAKKYEKELKEGDVKIINLQLKEICPGF